MNFWGNTTHAQHSLMVKCWFSFKKLKNSEGANAPAHELDGLVNGLLEASHFRSDPRPPGAPTCRLDMCTGDFSPPMRCCGFALWAVGLGGRDGVCRWGMNILPPLVTELRKEGAGGEGR